MVYTVLDGYRRAAVWCNWRHLGSWMVAALEMWLDNRGTTAVTQRRRGLGGFQPSKIVFFSMGKWWCSQKYQGLTRRMGDFFLWNKWWLNPEFYRDSSTQNSIWYGYINACRGKHPAKKSILTQNWGYHGSGSPVNSLVVSNVVCCPSQKWQADPKALTENKYWL